MSYEKRIKRDTNADLMNGIVKLVKENGWYDKAKDILDYYLPESSKVKEISNYEFDFYAVVNYGGSEGIYILIAISRELLMKIMQLWLKQSLAVLLRLWVMI